MLYKIAPVEGKGLGCVATSTLEVIRHLQEKHSTSLLRLGLC